jgi:hypothetical protein
LENKLRNLELCRLLHQSFVVFELRSDYCGFFATEFMMLAHTMRPDFARPNCMLTPFGGAGKKPVTLDFGNARLVHDAEGVATGLGLGLNGGLTMLYAWGVSKGVATGLGLSKGVAPGLGLSAPLVGR